MTKKKGKVISMVAFKKLQAKRRQAERHVRQFDRPRTSGPKEPPHKHAGIIKTLRNLAKALDEGTMDQCVVVLFNTIVVEGGRHEIVRTAYCQHGYEDDGLAFFQSTQVLDLIGVSDADE